jgi:hypothetical protein
MDDKGHFLIIMGWYFYSMDIALLRLSKSKGVILRKLDQTPNDFKKSSSTLREIFPHNITLG